MPATASTRTGMRWPSSSSIAIAAIVGIAIATACVTSTTRFYLPSTEQGTITIDELRDRASALLGIECPRLENNHRGASGVMEVTAEVDSAGVTERMRVERGSGDKRVDDIIGGLAAQLVLSPVPENGRAGLAIGYTCSAGSAAVTVERSSR